MIEIVKRLKHIIEERQISMNQSAKIINCSNRVLYRWLNDEVTPTIKMQRRIRSATIRIGHRFPKRDRRTSEDYAGPDKDKKGKFIKGHRVAIKTQVDARARAYRLPTAKEKAEAFRRAEEDFEELKKETPNADSAMARINLKCVLDLLKRIELNRLNFEKVGQTMDEKSYIKGGVVVPSTFLDTELKLYQELRRFLKLCGVAIEGISIPESPIELAHKKYRGAEQ